MIYDIDDFVPGDEIQYISECSDHDEAQDRSEYRLFVGGLYDVLAVDIRNNQVLLYIGEDEWGDDVNWWVNIEHVKPLKDVGDKTHPHYKVIRKIKQMDTRRKEKGYAF